MTLKEIAEKAGVSTTTVHRVLRGKGEVSPETVERIMEIIKINDPRLLVKKQARLPHNSTSDPFRTKCIGLLLAGLPTELLKTPLFVKILTEMETCLADYGLMLSVMQIMDPENMHPMISPEYLDGAFLFAIRGVPSNLLRSRLKEVHTIGLLGSAHCAEGWADWVTSDFNARGRIAVNYLHSRGHRRVAFLNPMPEHAGFEESGIAFGAAANKQGLQVTMLVADTPYPSRIWHTTEGEPIVQVLVDQLLQQPAAQRPTGLYVVNDAICLCVYKLLRERGVEPGKDIDIISADNDEEFLSRMSPRPATMDLNVPEIVHRAIEELIFRIKNPDVSLGITVLVPPKLIPSEA